MYLALQRAVGLVQHHDGLSGTEKQSVADDYSLRLNDGIIQAEKEMNEVLFVIGEKEPYSFCLLANTSVCDVSTQNTNFEVLVHNALARTSVQTFSIPITHKSAEVTLLSGDASVREQNVYVALPVHSETQVAPNSFVFSAELKPLSTTRFLVKQKESSKEEEYLDDGAASVASDSENDDVVVLENQLVRAEIRKSTGSITKLANKKKNIQIPLSLDVAYYQAFQGDGPKSGAYVFRPDSNKTYPVTGNGSTTNSMPSVTMVNLQTHKGATASRTSVPRVAFKIGDWVTLEYRVNDADEFLEIEWTVGPVPIADKKGKEVIVRFDAGKSIASDATLYTDSNGLEFMKRVRNHRDTWNLTLHDNTEAVAANYFPITTGAYIKDTKHQLNVVTDRAQGAASLVDGQVEVMVHRRLLADDNKGVAEFLNETESVYDSNTKKQVTKGLTVRGNFFVNVDSAEDGMRSIRSKMESQFFRPLTVFRKPVSSEVKAKAKVPWLRVGEFPANVGLTTLQELSKQCLLVRLSHLYAVDEHSTLSKPVTVDFSTLFSVENAKVSELTEMVLTGTKELSEEAVGMEWKTTDDTYGWSPRSLPVKGTSVTLQAIEVRAFRLCFAKASEDVGGSVVVADADADVTDSWDEAEESFGVVLQDLAEIIDVH
ncbi:Lysosomal alpha-mannosidase [Phytophthora citrophthora]|uniref:Lysosomal alpha-mannosidase n=1 Tax=Phytophthora citrophthora TaxID=4793 RepID=A0AAD9GGH6_9STRA|nr:Lysosomal alpha-mannosidase [Phytophthora citrophthora]